MISVISSEDIKLTKLYFFLYFQIAVGIGLIWNALYDIKNEDDLHVANRINNFTVIGIFLVVVLNVFIAVFAVDDSASTIVVAP